MPGNPQIALVNVVKLNIAGQKGISPNDINNHGQVVGMFTDANSVNHGFLYDSGAFAQLDYPGATNTSANGINNLGQIVGSFLDANNKSHGFVYNAGNFSSAINCPGAAFTDAMGINDFGLVVGSCGKLGGIDSSGFIYNNGGLQLFNAPNTNMPTPTTVFGDINDGGQVVGFFWIKEINHGTSFLYNPNVFTPPLDYPYGGPPIQNGTTLRGINNRGHIVGTFNNPNIPIPFVFSAGTCYQIVVPGASAASAAGINDYAQIVGFFRDASGENGYLATLAV